MMNHETAYDLIESYAFGSLEAPEHEGVEVHLDSGCEACLQRLREAGELSVQLAMAVPQHQPPEHVRSKIFDHVRGDGPARQSRSRRGVVAWASAAVMAAASIVLVVWMADMRQDMSELRAERDAARAEVVRLVGSDSAEEEARHLLGKPCTRLVDLAGVDPNPQAFGKVILHPDETVGVIYVYRMPQVAEGMNYQLWMMRDGESRSVGVFEVAEDGSAILRLQALPDPATIAAFQVTIEPAGGRPSPTGMMYLAGLNSLYDH